MAVICEKICDTWLGSLQIAEVHKLKNFLDYLANNGKDLCLPTERNTFPLALPVFSSRFANETHKAAKRIVELAYIKYTQLYRGSPERLVKEAGMHPDSISFFSSSDRTLKYLTSIARPDAIVSNGIAKFVELNIDTAIGGMPECTLLPFWYLNSSIARIVVEIHEITATLPLRIMANFLQKVAINEGLGSQPNLGILEFEYQTKVQHTFASLMRSYGIPAVYANQDFVTENDGYLHFNAKRLDIGLRCFSLEAIEFPKDLPYVESLIACTKKDTGTLLLSNGISALVSNKRILAHLSAASDLSPEDERLVKNHLPWTREVRSGRVRYESQSVELEDLLQEKSKFVLKPGYGEQGKGVIVDHSVTTSAWEEAVRLALESSDFCVQECVRGDTISLPFLSKDETTVEVNQCPYVIGVYLIGEEPAGILVRLSRNREVSVLNYAQGAVVTCALFSGS